MLVLRCADTRSEHVTLQRIDRMFGDALSDILNIDFTESILDQVRLPTRLGGLGVRSMCDLAAPCILSSLHASQRLVQSLLPEADFQAFESALTGILTDFCAPGRTAPDKKHRQRDWDAIVCEESYDAVFAAQASNKDKARLRAVASAGASKWLQCLPSANLGTLLDDNTTRVCVGLRIGANIVEPHQCVCGQPVSADASHGLSCSRNAGRWSRHSQINDTFSRALRSAQIPNLATGCQKVGEFLLQKLSLDVRRGNAAAVMGTLQAYHGPQLGLPWPHT